jgi:tripartite-type tricarboxylate transporter receptor subunit TctC
VVAGLAALGATAGTAIAARRITLLVGAPAGSSTDVVARAFLPFMGKHWPMTEVVVRNLAGEGGLAALNALAEATPSGATLGWVATPALSARMVDRSSPALLKGLTLLGAVQREPVAFVSPAAAPLDSVADIIRRAGEDADAIPLGTPPPGSPPHLAALKLQVVSQTRLTIITFPSAAAARQAVLAGNVSAAALGLSDAVTALRDGRLSGIGLAARNRFGMLPDLPVLSEAGVPLAAFIRRGLAAPAGLPADVADRLTGVLKEIAEDPEFKALGEANGFVPSWTDAKAWVGHIEAERTDLATLWSTEPWLPSSGG